MHRLSFAWVHWVLSSKYSKHSIHSLNSISANLSHVALMVFLQTKSKKRTIKLHHAFSTPMVSWYTVHGSFMVVLHVPSLTYYTRITQYPNIILLKLHMSNHNEQLFQRQPCRNLNSIWVIKRKTFKAIYPYLKDQPIFLMSYKTTKYFQAKRYFGKTTRWNQKSCIKCSVDV